MFTMKAAMELANKALEVVAVNEPESVGDTTVLWLNADGTYSVTDNGEEVSGLTSADAKQIMIENLTADYD